MIRMSRCQKVIDETIGDTEAPADRDYVGLVNRAGEYLVSMHAWRWKKHRRGNITLVDGQDWAALPDDLASLDAMERYCSNGASITLTTTQTLLDALQGGGALHPPDQRYLAAMMPIEPSGGGEITYRLELWPTPELESGSGGTDATVRMYYTAGWSRITDADEEIPLTMPGYCEGLFEDILRAYARGTIEEDIGTVDARLAEIAKGQQFDAAKARDGSAQPDLGRPTGGQITTAMRNPYGPLDHGVVENPS